MALKPYWQLVRLPNLFTAAADSLAGWLVVSGSLSEPGRWVPLVAASVATYAGGIVLNDVFDHEIDLRERPFRPLPSGQVSRRLAAWFGAVALVMGPCLAALSGSMISLSVALILAATVIGYDAGLKRTWLGPEVMGTCRGLNFLLGMSQAPELGGAPGWLIAGSLALFVVGVTWISRSEVESGRTRGLVAGLILENLGMVGMILAPFGFVMTLTFADLLDESRVVPKNLRSGFGGLIVLLGVAFVINRAGWKAFRRPVPETFQRAVKAGVLSLVWLDVVAVASVRGPSLALAVAVLWVPAFLLARWLYST